MGLHKVYIELVFADNFIVNLLILLLASRLTKTRIRWGRFCAAGALGGAYACVAFGMGDAFLWLPVKIAVGFAMCFAAFSKRGERGFWKNACAFWASSFVLVGAVYASMLSFGEPATIGGAVIVRAPVRFILVGLFVGAVVMDLLARVKRRVRERENQTETIVLELNGRKTLVKAFVDSGNMVREPLSGLSVVFLSRAATQELLGNNLLALMYGQEPAQTDRLRIIPCCTAAGQGLFYGIEIDGVSLKDSKHSLRAVVCESKTPIAGGFGAIAGTQLMDELKKGAVYEDALGTKADRGDHAEAGSGRERRLHQRKRGTAAAADTPGGGDAAATAGGGRQVGQTGSH